MSTPSNTIDLRFHKRQSDAYLSTATELLYGGAAGGGKSYLMRASSVLWGAAIPGLQMFLFRRLSDDLIKNHVTGSGGYLEMLAPWLRSGAVRYNGSANFFEFWNKARVWLCHCQYEKDVYKYQGAEIHILYIDELTHFTEFQYNFLRGRVRLGGLKVPAKYRGLFPRIINGSNPGGAGHTFVRRMFIAKQPPFAIRQMSDEEGGLRRQFIPARLEDNPTLTKNDPDYAKRLSGLGSKALVKAMREGDWDIVAGGALDDLWDSRVHVIPLFSIPRGWRIDRSLDWGSSKPFSVGFWAEADGTEATFKNGTKWCPPKGTLVRFAEIYGSLEVGTNKGIDLGARDLARRIKRKEATLRAAGIIQTDVRAGPADNSIEVSGNRDSKSVGTLMREEGVHWTPSDKSPGSRLNGLVLVRERLRAAHRGEEPAIYFTANCAAALGTLPVLPRDPKNMDDVDSAAEDHCYDETRYRVLASSKEWAESMDVSYPS